MCRRLWSGAGADTREARHGTLLLVVGRGSSDPDANGDVAKLMRVLWESLGFGWGLVAYSGVTFPLVAPALERAAKLGFGRIVVATFMARAEGDRDGRRSADELRIVQVS